MELILAFLPTMCESKNPDVDFLSLQTEFQGYGIGQ